MQENEMMLKVKMMWDEINEIIDISSQADYFENFNAGGIFRVCALITNSEHLVHIIKKTNEMINTSNCKMIITIMTDIYFVVPQGKLILRLINEATYGVLIFYTELDTYFTGFSNPSRKNYESVKLDNLLLTSLQCVLLASLHVEKQVDRIMYTHIFSNHTSVTIEHIPFFGKFVNIQVLVSSKLLNVNRKQHDAIAITKNLMQELLITKDDLIRNTI